MCVQNLFRTRYEWLIHTVSKACKSFWKDLLVCRGKEKLALLNDTEDYDFEDDVQEAKELKEAKQSKTGLLRRRGKKGEDYYRRDQQEDSRSSDDEYFDSPPQYPPWVWQAMGMEDPLSLYAIQPGAQQQGFYVDPASMGEHKCLNKHS